MSSLQSRGYISLIYFWFLCFFVKGTFLVSFVESTEHEEIILNYPSRLDPSIRSWNQTSGKEVDRSSNFLITEEEKQQFLESGYTHIGGFLSPSEIEEIESIFDSFVEGSITPPGKDFCDMSQPLNTPMSNWRLVNAMLPRVYHPPMQNNTFEKRALSVARQLLGDDMEIDYDQFLMKKKDQQHAKFAWHQDLAYWPKDTPDFRTVTISLAINDAEVENGCLMVIPESNKETKLRNHVRLGEGTEDIAHTLDMKLEKDDKIVYIPLKAGDISIHDERIVHGSGGNKSKERNRKTYVLAFRSRATIEYERSIGFTHSHNDFQPPINEDYGEEKEPLECKNM